MNLDSASSASPAASNQRKERGAIAAQACDTCRSRKQRCDEQRPKCGLCQRMKLECRYREPQPTKKDKTLVEILDRLTSLEGKVDQLSTIRSPVPGFGPRQPSPSSEPSFSVEVDESIPFPTSHQPSQPRNVSAVGKGQSFRHASGSIKMVTWPAIQQLLLQSLPSNIGDLKSLDQEGSAFLIALGEGSAALPLDDTLQGRPFVGMQSQATRSFGGTRMAFPTLTRDTMHRLATVYFDSFNLYYPILDRQNFISDTLTRVHSEGFDGDTDSVIALLVFALGELAIEGSDGNPIEVYKGRSSGVRGGTAIKPPGLALFNEARKRIGFVLTKFELENVQIFSLAALYYECCFRHVDFWRMTMLASQACQTLITIPVDWSSQRGDLVKRAYWHCVMMETGLNLELDVPPTGLAALENRVGIPSFNAPFCEADHRGNQASHFEAHYASQVALWRLCANLRNTINDAMTSTANTPASSNNDGLSGSASSSLKQLSSKLTQWRGLLPQELQWVDDDPASFPTAQLTDLDAFHQALDPNLSRSVNSTRLAHFTADLDSPPVYYPYIYDIQVALLRTRYYYTKYMVYQPFVYKALHFPELMTREDAEGAAECLRSCLKWPILHSPTSRRKRLIPYLFGWSQAFLGILLIFQMTQHDPMLREIRAQFCGPIFEAELDQTVELLIDWVRDLKGCDSIAMWCWNILQGIYRLDVQEEIKAGKN